MLLLIIILGHNRNCLALGHQVIQTALSLDIYLINDKYQYPVSHRIMLQQDKEHQNSQGTRETICKLTNFWWHRIHEVSTNSIMRKIIMTGYYIKISVRSYTNGHQIIHLTSRKGYSIGQHKFP